MKKKTSAKIAPKKAVKKITPKSAVKTNEKSVVNILQKTNLKKSEPAFHPWSLSVYVYWFIIIFFISATFYVIGRSQGFLQQTHSNVTISEESLLTPNEYYVSGRAKIVSGDISGAISDLTVAINSENPSVSAIILRGEAFMQQGDYKNAMADFDYAISLDDLNSVAYYDRSLLNTRLGDYQSALSDINNALAARATRPNDVLQLRDIYAKRGKLNLWLKNWDGAIADYTNSLSLPDGVVNPSVYAERAEAFTAKGNYADAINDYMSAVRVISEQIQGSMTADSREDLSRSAMGYFEKSAALNLRMNNIDGARADLESAITIANALGDSDTSDRLRNLIMEL